MDAVKSIHHKHVVSALVLYTCILSNIHRGATSLLEVNDKITQSLEFHDIHLVLILINIIIRPSQNP